MTAPSVKPFNFDELAPQEQATTETVFTEEDMEAARNEGAAAGRAEAQASLIKKQTNTLKAIKKEFDAAQENFYLALDQERAALKAITAEFLNAFCMQVCAANEVEIANGLLDQLLQNSTDQSPATLSVNPESLEQLKAHFHALIDARNASDFISVLADENLALGECRIHWRGGSISRELKSVRDAVAAMTNAERPQPSQLEKRS